LGMAELPPQVFEANSDKARIGWSSYPKTGI